MGDEHLNPYASPQSLDQAARATNAAAAIYSRPYISARGKANWAIGTAVFTIVLHFVLFVSCCMQLMLLRSMQYKEIPEGITSSNDMRQLIVASATGVAEIATLFTFLVWIYSTHANLPALGNTHLDLTSGWAVGWFFVPIMNRFKPYQVVFEIWRSSDPANRTGATAGATTLIGWWWCLRVLTGLVERGANRLGRYIESVEGWIGHTWLVIAMIVLLSVPMLILQILLVRKIQRFQEDRFTIINCQQPSEDFRDPLATLY